MSIRNALLTVLFGSFLFTFFSCLEIAKGINDWTQAENLEDVEGQTHFLSDDGIKIFLPNSFKKYSTIAYTKLLDSIIVEEKDMEIERTRIKYMREMEGNHYIFFDGNFRATLTLNTIPYAPITRQDAKYILGVLRQSQEKMASQTDLNYSKITAKHNDSGKAQIFKAIFKIENPKLKTQMFQHAYFISSNQKTLLINLMSPFQVDFDPYIEKIIL